MTSIFEELLIQKIKSFVEDFKESSTDLFYDKEGQRLIHPGEYGIYREKICKDFLKHFSPSRYDFGTGFIIDTQNDVSSQCDIILYDPQTTPLIQDAELQTFYPVESVVAIGEIKSKLSKADFSKTLMRLSKIKEMREKIKTPVVLFQNPGRLYNPKEYHYDQIFTFLICEKFEFNCQGLVNEFNSLYKKTAITHRHNLILSINDGLICYYDENNKSMMYPFHRNKQLRNRMVTSDDKMGYFKMFASYFFLGTSSTTILYPEISDYMGSIVGGMNINEQQIKN